MYGELLGEVPTPADVPIVEGLWQRNSTYRFRLPAVMGTLWQARDGRRLACLVNVSGKELRHTWRLGNTDRTLTLAPRSVTSIPLP